MIKKILYSLILLLLIPYYSWATTYYMAKNPCSGNAGWGNGSDSNAGSKAAPFLTLRYSLSQMSGGDDLVIDDGTYTGATNSINTGVDATVPPIGSSENYTLIQAENSGQVVFDGENARSMFYWDAGGDARYCQFDGLIWARSNSHDVMLYNGTHIKFITCGAYDVGDGNTSNFYIGSASYSTSYILFEGCYAYGSGRYKFLTYHGDHLVYRNCVGRPDNIDTTGSPNPSAVFSVYSSTYVKVQNCIAIDADQDDNWITNAREGCYFVPTTSGSSEDVSFESCIGLNVKLGGIQVTANSSTENVTFTNIALWDCPNYAESSDYGLFMLLRGDSGATGDYVTNVTYGANGVGSAGYSSWGISWPSLKNSIFYNLQPTQNFWGWGTPTINDYNCYYGNSNNTGRSGAHDLTATNPMTNSLRYLPRIEAGSDLDNAGDGVDIGANVSTLIGTTGSLWGDSGYDTDTEISMWPFPNEALIKTKMAAYSGDEISGERGFCATGKQLNGTDDITLTSYIWEYLGNQIPSDIYGDETAPTLSSVTIQSDGITWEMELTEAPAIGAGGNDGWAAEMNTAGVVDLTYDHIGGNILYYTGDVTVYATDTIVSGSYTQPGNGVEDGSGNDLATVSDFTGNFTNSSAQTPAGAQGSGVCSGGGAGTISGGGSGLMTGTVP